jgi:hypothetical protein
MNYQDLVSLLTDNLGTLLFSLFGALILTFKAIKEHIDRDPKDKMSYGKYSIYLFGWLVGYPISGVTVASSYLASGNHFGSWLALQIGLTSPAILAGILSGGANAISSRGVETVPGQ